MLILITDLVFFWSLQYYEKLMIYLPHKYTTLPTTSFEVLPLAIESLA
jgi:hypothetical protein